MHPAEEAVWSFAPDKDRVDKILYEGIVDEDESRNTQFPRVTRGGASRGGTTRGGTAMAGFGDGESFKELLPQEDDD